MIFDPPFDLDDIPIEVNPEFPPIPPDDPWGPIGPRPGPDPAPIELQPAHALPAARWISAKLQLLRAKAQLPKISARSCAGISSSAIRFSGATAARRRKSAEGFVQDGGAFSVCWREPLRLFLPQCHEEFAYVIKQPIGGTLVTIYNGVAANQWFGANDQPTLTSYQSAGHRLPRIRRARRGRLRRARRHRLPPRPTCLATPTQDFVPVGRRAGLQLRACSIRRRTPPMRSGQLLNRNFGGGVALQYDFTETMRGAGAIYYRIQVAAADASGDPVGSWTPLVSHDVELPGISTPQRREPIASRSTSTVGAETNLSKIPYNTGDPLGANEEWQDGQYHGVIPTNATSPTAATW